MNPLVAKAVFDQLTLADVLEMSEPDEIQVDTPYEQTYRFSCWSIENDELHLLWSDYNSIPDPKISLHLNSRVVQVDDHFCIEGKEDFDIFFCKIVPFRVSSVLSSEKAMGDGG